MGLSSEIFVMIICLAGLPIFIWIVHSSELPGAKFFLLTYSFLLLSNICTVIEEFYFREVFNTLEHYALSVSAILLCIAVWQFTAKSETSE